MRYSRRGRRARRRKSDAVRKRESAVKASGKKATSRRPRDALRALWSYFAVNETARRNKAAPYSLEDETCFS
ncbi:hypothetical protein EVAR_32467_1 [Eumeta japonica]|uniref:Uncharacterized protein n=1 Tax=Eumeta variegata TaxID=151549 RepID=A0A4C1VLM0_EUMVA|nr:hypothetical protein EVAR_32467_1 [Eumeta japonica]